MRLRDIARLCLRCLFGLMSAAVTAGSYNPRETFAPFDMGQAPTVYRSADGRPGPQYWQNRADYTIRAALDPASHVAHRHGRDPLHQQQPAAARRAVAQPRAEPLPAGLARRAVERHRRRAGITEGMSLDSVKLVQGKRTVAVQPLISDTRAQIRLPAPLAHGATATLRIAYHYTVPKDPWGGRTGWMDSPNGPIYSVAQWYPRMAVYDDIRGWDPLPYLAAGILSRIRRLRLFGDGARRTGSSPARASW